MKKITSAGCQFFFCTLATVLGLVHGLNISCQPRYNDKCGDKSCDIKLTESVIVKTGELVDIASKFSLNPITQIRVLAISDNQSQISTMLSEIFEQLRNIDSFELYSDVEGLNKGDFEKANKLRDLTVYNRLRTIPAGLSTSAKNLEKLSLSMNQITEIEDNAFVGLNVLRRLELENNNLTIIKQNTFNGLRKLEILVLKSNQIETIEENALNLPNLKQLYVDNNKLTSLSDHLFSATPLLYYFNANENQINHIGNSLYGLMDLVTLILSNNKITDADLVAFSQMPALQELCLYKSGLTSDKISRIDVKKPSESVVAHLSLGHNDLTNNEDWKKFALVFPQLERIDVQNTKYSKIDFGNKTLRQEFPNLETVYVSSGEWSYDWLESFVESRKKDGINITIIDSSKTNGSKVNGIGCV